MAGQAAGPSGGVRCMRCTLLIVAGVGCEACVRICYGSQAAAAQVGPSPSRGQRVLWGPLMCEAPTRRGGTVPLPAVRSWAARTSQPGSGAPEAQLRLGGRTDHARPRRLADGDENLLLNREKSCGTRGGHQPWPRAQKSRGCGRSLPLEGREDGDRATGGRASRESVVVLKCIQATTASESCKLVCQGSG